MLCSSPFVKGALPLPCGQCLPCRINRRRVWTHRLILESFAHATSCFVTLTYADDQLPEGGVSKRELQLFHKRLRELLAPRRYRHYSVGEYGSRTGRAHYHCILFGVDVATARQALPVAWRFGHVHAGDASPAALGYVAGYVSGKVDRRVLGGRAPEFALMSRRPGIGHHAVQVVSDHLSSRAGAVAVGRAGGVPGSLRHGGKSWPLGRYLTDRIGAVSGYPVGMDSPRTQAWVAEMSALRDAVGHASFAVATPFLDRTRILQMESRHRIRESGKVL